MAAKEDKEGSKAAAELAVEGLRLCLTQADTADAGVREGMMGVCLELHKDRKFTALDALASGPCVAL